MELAIDEIRTGDRIRKDMGDIKSLAESIARHGFLHPVVVMKDHTLVAGARRIEAARSLGLADVPVTVVDVDDLLSAERDENEIRKDFTPTEAVAIGRLIEERERPLARERHVEGARLGGQTGHARRRGAPDPVKEKGTSTGRAGSVDTIAADAVGMSTPTYFRARAVVVAAETEPARFGDLPARMDETTVTETYRELQRRGGGPQRKKVPPRRHPIHNKRMHPRPNLEMQRAVIAIEGLCLGLESVDIAGLDPAKTEAWSISLRNAASFLGRIARKVSSVKAA